MQRNFMASQASFGETSLLLRRLLFLSAFNLIQNRIEKSDRLQSKIELKSVSDSLGPANARQLKSNLMVLHGQFVLSYISHDT